MYAEEARKKFWNTLRESLKEKGEPFFFTENKQWAIINKPTSNFHEPCVAVDFLWRDEFLRINVYIENDIPLYNKLKMRKEEIEKAVIEQTNGTAGLEWGDETIYAVIDKEVQLFS